MDRTLTPLADIQVPKPAPDEVYRTTCFERSFAFAGLKALLGAADCSKAGDRHAGLAAKDELEREAARLLLSSLSLGHLHDHPLTDDCGQIDSVMRVNYDIDRKQFASIAGMTLSQFKDHLLRATPEAIAPVGRALTGPMAAALAKICDVHDLILLAQKLPSASRARTTLGGGGTLASRLQPNHPTDDLRGITLLVYWGLSLGAGDALIGVNPAVDTVENVETVLKHLDKLRRATAHRRKSACSHISRRSWNAWSTGHRSKSCFRAWPAPNGRSPASSTSRSICWITAIARCNSAGRCGTSPAK